MARKNDRYECIAPLVRAGIDEVDAYALRRISMTLRRWFALECGDSNDRVSFGIERDENTQKPFMVRRPHDGNKFYRSSVADREAGAMKRLKAIMQRYPMLTYYIQWDPRGAALHILRPGDVPEGQDPGAYCSRGLAVY